MAKILNVRTPSDYSRWVGQTDPHPMISVIDYDKVSPVKHSLNYYHVYGLFLRDDDLPFSLQYGRGGYEYKKSSLICVAPGQLGGKEDNDELVNLSGYALLFHPDILHGFPLEKEIKNLAFFEYRINEALHLNEYEKELFFKIMQRIQEELNHPADNNSTEILVGLIGLMLSYCKRIYGRQFPTRITEKSDLLIKFENMLKQHFAERQSQEGLPSIKFFADRLCVSPNYLGDIIKKTTGITAGNYIRNFMIQEAKNMLSSGYSVSETAYALGFDYPQHFSRIFKRIEGLTPTQYIGRLK